MEIAANVIGVIAVILFTLSYQQKKRKNIIIMNATSRVFYILQYLLLSAYSGAVLDVLGIVISLVANNKDKPSIKKRLPLFITGSSVLLIVAGVIFYENFFSLFSLLGILFHVSAFWLTDERKIRWLSLIGSPCWFVYNFNSHAFGSAIGDTLTFFSIIIAMIKYKKAK